ncbi:MAG: hypothetical protein WCO94_16220, partial [Verrucomicrobiota bacterium]
MKRAHKNINVPRSLLSALFLLLFISVAYSGGGRNRVSSGEATITPVKVPITVNGDLDDWDPAKAQVLTPALGSSENNRSPALMEAYSAKVAFQYDEKFLYAAIWWTDPNPLGPENSGGAVPPGDGLVLSIPGKAGVTRMAFWREPAGTE